MSINSDSPSLENLSRYIDRFLFADGWRITCVSTRPDGGGYNVTLTEETKSGPGRSVVRSAASAGEATFKACSSARLLDALPQEA